MHSSEKELLFIIVMKNEGETSSISEVLKYMTPAINTAKKARIDFHIHEYTHAPKPDSYGEEAAEKLGIEKEKVFKTLVVSADNGELCVAVLPVSHQ